MTFHMNAIKECLSTWVHVRILETLMHEPRATSQRQLALLMGIHRATAHRALNDLGQTGLIKPHKVGNATYWEIDKQGYLYETLLPILKGLCQISPPLPYLKNLIKKTLKLPKGCRCLIFGSTNEGKDSSSSDIDLAIVLPNGFKTPSSSFQKDLDKLQDLCREKFGKGLSPFFISDKELKKQDKELHRNILKGMEITS